IRSGPPFLIEVGPRTYRDPLEAPPLHPHTDLIIVPGFISPLDLQWTDLGFSRFLRTARLLHPPVSVQQARNPPFPSAPPRADARGVRSGIDVRAGLHTGECELVDGKVAGIAGPTSHCSLPSLLDGLPLRSRNGLIRSIGAGKMIFV